MKMFDISSQSLVLLSAETHFKEEEVSCKHYEGDEESVEFARAATGSPLADEPGAEEDAGTTQLQFLTPLLNGDGSIMSLKANSSSTEWSFRKGITLLGESLTTPPTSVKPLAQKNEHTQAQPKECNNAVCMRFCPYAELTLTPTQALAIGSHGWRAVKNAGGYSWKPIPFQLVPSLTRKVNGSWIIPQIPKRNPSGRM
jgi:hypothetical protein